MLTKQIIEPKAQAPNGATIIVYLDAVIVGTIHVHHLDAHHRLEVETMTGHVKHPGRCLAPPGLAAILHHE